MPADGINAADRGLRHVPLAARTDSISVCAMYQIGKIVGSQRGVESCHPSHRRNDRCWHERDIRPRGFQQYLRYHRPFSHASAAPVSRGDETEEDSKLLTTTVVDDAASKQISNCLPVACVPSPCRRIGELACVSCGLPASSILGLT